MGEFGEKKLFTKNQPEYSSGDRIELTIEKIKRYSLVANKLDGGHTKLFAELDAMEDVFKALGAKTIFAGYDNAGLHGTNARTRKIGLCE